MRWAFALIRAASSANATQADASDAVIVNEELARRYWAGEDPIGKRLQIGTERRAGAKSSVLSPTRDSGILEASPDPAIYVPFAQNTWPNALRISSIVVRSRAIRRV